ncbi:MAG TPA: hypothetical protein VEK15_31035 [Vicinamibacteria bacterium]|nr:hypothetical protein [Vicinamibacteria bacterium]
MDIQTVFYLLLFVFWLLSQIASQAKKARRQEEAPPVARGPTRPRLPQPIVGLDREAQQVLAVLRRASGELDECLLELEPSLRAQASFIVDRSLRSEAETTVERLESAIAAKEARSLSVVLERAREVTDSLREITTTARTHSTIRRRPETSKAQVVADRLVDEFQARFAPHAAAAQLELIEAPPVALIWDLGDDRLGSSPLAGSTLFVPRSVTNEPLEWVALPFEIARYLGDAAPGLYREIYDRLELRVTDSDVASRPEALARLLFAAYVVRILGDALGATLFGPTYLRVLARVHASPQSPLRVTTLRLNPDGTVHPEPPAHLRIRWTAAWVTLLGYSSEAEENLRQWTEQHQNPSSLALSGAQGSLPLPPIESVLDTLTEQLFFTELEALGSKRLADLPGIADWRLHAKGASRAKAMLSSGKLAEGSPRQLVVAAMDAALDSPEQTATLGRRLYESIIGPAAVDARVPAKRSKPLVAIDRRGPRRPGSHELVEALILGELLLERPRGPWRNRVTRSL